jgi:hypothetical protein
VNGTNTTTNGNTDNLPPTMVSTNNLQSRISTDEIKSPTMENQQDEQLDNDNGKKQKFVLSNSFYSVRFSIVFAS